MDRPVLGSDPSKLKSRMEYLERAKAYGETRGIVETGTNVQDHVNGAGNGPGILKSPLVKRRSITDGTKQFVDMPKRVHFAKTVPVSPKSVPLQTQDATEAVNPDGTQTTTSSGSRSGIHVTDTETSNEVRSVNPDGHNDSSTGTCAASSDLQADGLCANVSNLKVSTEYPGSRSRESTVTKRPSTPFWRTNPFDKLDDTIKRQTITNLLCESSDLLQKYDGHSSGCGKTSRTTRGKDYKVPLSESVAVVTAANSVAMVTTPKIQTRNSVAMATPCRSLTLGSVTVATTPNLHCFDSGAMTTAPKIRTERSATMVTKPRIQTGTAQYRSRSVSPSPRCMGVPYSQNKVLYNYTFR